MLKSAPCVLIRTLFVSVLFFSQSDASEAIGRKEFFDRLDEKLRSIQTFQADVIQESRYNDGIVQGYKGELVVSSKGRVAYDYELDIEYEDESLQVEESSDPARVSPAPVQRKQRDRGTILTKDGRVNHFYPDRNLIEESAEDESLLVQLFQVMVGAGNFDVKEFRANHKINAIREDTFEGIPVYVMVAEPKKGSDLYKNWQSKTSNEMIEWTQELWVERSTMGPVKAVLASGKESTAVRLRNVRVNEPIPSDAYAIQVESGQNPVKLLKGRRDPGPEFRTVTPIEKPLEEIRIEE